MTEFQLSTKQELFLKHLHNGDNIYLNGKAGVGKSYVVNVAIKQLKERGKNVVSLAPTGVAANNIGGQTIHSLFSIVPHGVANYKSCNFVKQEKRNIYNNIDVMFIDEISMLRPDILDAIDYTMQKNKCKPLSSVQIVFIGDLKQLQSVLKGYEREVLLNEYKSVYFYEANIYSKLNTISIELDEVLRQSNEDFINALNIIRDGGRSEYFRQFVGKEKRGVILAPHNSTVNEYNINGLNEINEKPIVLTADIEGNIKPDDFNLEQKITLKNGCSIMYLANSKVYPLVNGTLGKFVVKANKYFIETDGRQYLIEPVMFTKKEYYYDEYSKKLELREVGSITQYPIKLAYALTIHKSQGLSFDEMTLDLTKSVFSPCQMYVALSRVRTPEGLTIITK